MRHSEEALRRFYARDLFAAAQGIQIDTLNEQQVVCSVPLRGDQKNGVGLAHGGLLYTLADFTFAVCCAAHGQAAVTLSAHIHYVGNVQNGRLVATARRRGGGKTVAVYEVEVRAEDGALLAVMTADGYALRDDPIDEM